LLKIQTSPLVPKGMAIISNPIEAMGSIQDKDGRPPRYEISVENDGDNYILKAQSQPVRAVLNPEFVKNAIVIRFKDE
jgi:hypothetical protein